MRKQTALNWRKLRFFSRGGFLVKGWLRHTSHRAGLVRKMERAKRGVVLCPNDKSQRIQPLQHAKTCLSPIILLFNSFLICNETLFSNAAKVAAITSQYKGGPLSEQATTPGHVGAATPAKANSGGAELEQEDAASEIPPLPSAYPDTDGEAPQRRLLPGLVVNLLVNSIMFPQLFVPLVTSIRSLHQTLDKPHKKHWAPEMSWSLGPCSLLVDFSEGYRDFMVRNISLDTFSVFMSRKTGRILIYWSDRKDPRTLWLKPRMEVATVPSSGWCKYNTESIYNVYTAGGGLQAAIVEFQRLGVNSYKTVSFMKEDEFIPFFASHFVLDADVEMFKEASIPEKKMAWDPERCMFQFLYGGAPGSLILQWNEESIRGLFRVIDVKKRVVLESREIYPNCTYDGGNALKSGVITMKNGRSKIIGFVRPLLTSEVQKPSDLELVKRQNVTNLDHVVPSEK